MRRVVLVKTMIASENQEQRALVQWLSVHPVLKHLFLKLNNEGKRTVVQGYGLKLMGLRPGASDLLIYLPSPKGSYHGLFLEVKRNKRYTKSEMSTNTWKSQIEFLERVKSVGYAGDICYGFLDGKRVIEEYLMT